MIMEPGHDRDTSADGPITLINSFEVHADQVEEFIAQWEARAKIMCTAPGFRDARLHRAVSPDARFQLVNIAHWDSQAHMDAALGNSAFQHRVRVLQEDPNTRFSAYPAVYEVAAVLSPSPSLGEE